MKIYFVNETFFAQKQDAIAKATQMSTPRWGGDDQWVPNPSVVVEVIDCDSKAKIVAALNGARTVSWRIEVSCDLMLSEINDKNAKPKIYIKDVKDND